MQGVTLTEIKVTKARSELARAKPETSAIRSCRKSLAPSASLRGLKAGWRAAASPPGLCAAVVLLTACAPAPEVTATVQARLATSTPGVAVVIEATQEPSPGADQVVTPAAAAGTTSCSLDFTNWREWYQLNEQPIEGHEVWVTVHLDEVAREPYSHAAVLMPECSRIVKAHLVSRSSPVVSRVTVMVKMPAGYDPEHGDWWYGMYDPEGKIPEMQGRVEVCIACHQGAAHADFLFAGPVLEAIEMGPAP